MFAEKVGRSREFNKETVNVVCNNRKQISTTVHTEGKARLFSRRVDNHDKGPSKRRQTTIRPIELRIGLTDALKALKTCLRTPTS